jgi:hypothetical protein
MLPAKWDIAQGAEESAASFAGDRRPLFRMKEADRLAIQRSLASRRRDRCRLMREGWEKPHRERAPAGRAGDIHSSRNTARIEREGALWASELSARGWAGDHRIRFVSRCRLSFTAHFPPGRSTEEASAADV